MSTLADNLRGAREAAELSREALAARSGVSVATIARTELYGHTPKVSILDALSLSLGCTVSDLLTSEAKAS